MSDISDQKKAFRELGYEAQAIGFGSRPAVFVIDMMRCSTQPGHVMSQKPLVMRAFKNIQKVLGEARSMQIPVVNCNMAYNNESEMPYWKNTTVKETYIIGKELAEIDPELHDPSYDFTVVKSFPSVFFGTPVASYLIRNKIDTVIITGINTSGCVRATCIDSFSYGYRTIIPEDCVGDFHDTPHKQNLDDVARRYADIVSSDDVLSYFRSLKQ